jgi:hypothetical protein
MPPSPLPPLLVLPNVLLWLIGHMLELPDLLCLRRTHRRLGQAVSRCTTVACIEKASGALIQHLVAQRHRLTHVQIKMTFPPTRDELAALVALATCPHLKTLDIQLYDDWEEGECESSLSRCEALHHALPSLCFPRLVVLRIGGYIWENVVDTIREMIVALLDHAHSLEQLEVNYGHQSCAQRPYTCTSGVVRTLANLRCLEIEDKLLSDTKASAKAAGQQLHLPCIEYICLGYREEDEPGRAQVQDIFVGEMPKLDALTVNMRDMDEFCGLPPTLRWCRVIAWSTPLHLVLVRALTSSDLPFLTTLAIEEYFMDREEIQHFADLAALNAHQQQFHSTMSASIARFPQLTTLHVSWHFQPYHVFCLLELARILPMLRIIHLECVHDKGEEDATMWAVVESLRSTLPAHVQMLVTRANGWSGSASLENNLRIRNNWLPNREWNTLVDNHLAIVESDTHRLAFA